MAASISEAEARVMEALWRESPLSAEQVIAPVHPLQEPVVAAHADDPIGAEAAGEKIVGPVADKRIVGARAGDLLNAGDEGEQSAFVSCCVAGQLHDHAAVRIRECNQLLEKRVNAAWRNGLTGYPSPSR